MKRSLLIVSLILIMTIFSACIISYSPKEFKQTISVGQSLTFNITLFQSQKDIKWFVDLEEQPDSYGKTTFTYTPGILDIGKHYILVVETSEQSGSQPVMWEITVED
jgi:hypothetical protein